MRTAQYERILEKLERTAELLKDPERAARAARLLTYPNIDELQKDINGLLDVYKRNRLFLIDIADTVSGLKLPAVDLSEFDFEIDKDFEIDVNADIDNLEINFDTGAE